MEITQEKNKGSKSKTENKWASLSLDDFINAASDSESDQEIGEVSSKHSVEKKDNKRNNKSKISSDSSSIPDGVDVEDVDTEENDEEEDVEDEDNECDEEADSENEDNDSSEEADSENEVNDGEEEADEEDDDDNDSDSNAFVGSEVKKHKATLEKLKTDDPEFYKFLSENDRELLEFDTSDSEDDNEKEDEVHKPPDELELASDDSDYEDKESAAIRKSNVVTQVLVDKWQENLKTDKSVKTIAEVVDVFRCAVQSVSEEKTPKLKYHVEGGTAFNSVVRLCIVDLIPAIKRYLKMTDDGPVKLEQSKGWIKVKLHVKSYLADVIRLLSSLAESSLLSVLLKHVHQLIPFYRSFIKITRVLCKRLVTLWCEGQDSVRVLAFLCLLRLARVQPEQLLEPLLKAMYLSYARNCKFTSPSTWPMINFMRRSLVEIMALQENLTYRHAFLYIRQLAIHLRNALTLKKKDSNLTVYNWQFVHCLHLWAALLGALPHSQTLKPLVYPLVQIGIGTINLVPTGRYYPLRFHVASILNKLSVDTGVFIPVLPFLLEILQKHNFEKKPSKTSMKPMDFSCILRVSQSQLGESGFRDAVIETFYDRLLECLESNSHSVAFPELALPVILQLKSFIKKCPVANYSKKLKQLLEKIQENVQFIEKKRSQVSFDLADTKAVMALENQVKSSGTPLSSYCQSWNKMREREMAIKIAKKVEVDKEYKLPTLKKPEKKTDDEDVFEGLFPSDLSDDEDLEERFKLKEERGLKRKPDESVSKPEKVETTAPQTSPPKKMKAVERKKPNVSLIDGPDIDDEVGEFHMSDTDDDEDAEDEENEDTSSDDEAEDEMDDNDDGDNFDTDESDEDEEDDDDEDE
nr:EOG090X02MG [Cyclestheria hislopi]